MSSKDVIESAVEHLRTTASVKTVYGEPIVINGKTIIPVARVAYGFGGGTRPEGEPVKGPAQPSTAEATTAAPPAPGPRPAGEAGGVIAKPVGVVEISGQETKFVSFGQTKKVATAAVIGSGLGLALGLLLGVRRAN